MSDLKLACENKKKRNWEVEVAECGKDHVEHVKSGLGRKKKKKKNIKSGLGRRKWSSPGPCS